MTAIYHTTLDTTLGDLLIASSERGLVRIIFPSEGEQDSFSTLLDEFADSDLHESREHNESACRQLTEYFEETRTAFDLPLDLRGTDFQKAVWEAVSRVPYGQTRTYGQIAEDIGNPGSIRAVGAANGANPIPIVVPCHRIIGADGSLTGYGGGIEIKRKLLVLEKNLLL